MSSSSVTVMSARADAADRRAAWTRRVLVGLGIGCGIAASGLLVLTQDARLLRLAVVLALWCGLLLAFATVRRRGWFAGRGAAPEDERVRQLQASYQQELEREVAARREHELSTELAVRRDVEREVRDETGEQLAALRQELQVLRQSLEQLTGGDVLFERIALHAQSARIRPLGQSGQVPLRHSGEQVTGGTVEPGPQPSPTPSPPEPPAEPPPEPTAEPEHAGAWGGTAAWERINLWSEQPAVPEPEAQPQPAGEPQQPENGVFAEPVGEVSAERPEGAHSRGRSVRELLAEHGAPQRRGRRRSRD